MCLRPSIVGINDPHKAKSKQNNVGLIKIIARISQEYYVAWLNFVTLVFEIKHPL